MPNEKKPSIDEAMKALNKKFGVGTVMKTSESDDLNIVSMPTGSIKLDYVFGCGGIPRGRIIELFGPESSGKSSLACSIVAEVQRRGGKCMWLDVEHCWDSGYARDLGVNTSEIIVSQPDYGEKAMEIVEEMAKTSAIDLIVLDSVAALMTKKEMESELVEESMARLARLMSKFMVRVNTVLAKHDTTVIFINQLRSNMVMYGPKEVTPGGKALKFFASVRLEVRKGKVLEKTPSEETVSYEMMVTGKKNKVGFPNRKVILKWINRKGLDIISEVLEVGGEMGVINKVGNTYSYGDTKLGVGTPAAGEYLSAHTDVLQAIRKEIEDKMSSLKPAKPQDYEEKEIQEEDQD